MLKLLIGIFLFAIFLYADSDEHDHHKERYLYETNLLIPLYDLDIKISDTQKEEIKSLFKELRKKLRHLKKDDDFGDIYAGIFEKERFDKERFLEMRASEQKETNRIIAEYLEKLHNILDAKQRRAFVENIEEWEFE